MVFPLRLLIVETRWRKRRDVLAVDKGYACEEIGLACEEYVTNDIPFTTHGSKTLKVA